MRAAVLGSPIAHSLSPALHRAAYAELGFDDWTYETVECTEADLAAFVGSRGPDWAGLSLTMPLKRTVLPLLDHVDPMAAATGGANTVVFRPDGRYGYNTDVQGIVDALTEAGAAASASVTIIGAGATACSALAALAELGAKGADVVVRAPSRAAALLTVAERLHLRVRLLPFTDLTTAPPPPAPTAATPTLPPTVNDIVNSSPQRDAVPGLLISTVPAGVADRYAERIRVAGHAPATVLDVVYAPWPTALAQAASTAGAVVVSGFAMLLHQAAAQVELMTGKPAPLEAMRAAGEAELARRNAAS
jgi:shikimate dehydrogenase